MHSSFDLTRLWVCSLSPTHLLFPQNSEWPSYTNSPHNHTHPQIPSLMIALVPAAWLHPSPGPLHILSWSPPLTPLPKYFTQQITSSLWLLQLLPFPGTNTLILLLPHKTKEPHHVPIPCFRSKLLTKSASDLCLFYSPSTALNSMHKC